ncbi:MAG: FG-GAP-like repeat-containing protein, partial [Candidatus Latescibacterota bacterium]
MRRRPIHALALVAALLGTGCSRQAPEPPAPSASPAAPAVTSGSTGASGEGAGVQFVRLTEQAGLDFVHTSGSPEQRYILESMAPGGAFFDYDGDGFLDVFLVNSSRIREATPQATNRLYRNVAAADGGGRRVFADVTRPAGLARSGWGMGCTTGDYDNDGDVDLYVTYWGPNVLYRNNGDGTFTDVTASAGVGDDRWGCSAAFADLDGDGFLDLFVANYLLFDMTDPPGGGLPCSDWKGLDVYCGPHGLVPQANVLYRNRGDGTFTDMSRDTGIDRDLQASLGVVFGDLDGDGDQDLYVANDGYPNLLYRNDGGWKLTEMGAFAGAAYCEEGRAQAGMGVASGDYDNDGDLDLFVTNFSDDTNTLYRNQGDGTFADHTAAAAFGGHVRPFLSWSTGLFDYDGDGWLDIYLVSGHIYPQVDIHPAGIRYAQTNMLFHNEGGTFRDLSPQAGPGLALEKVSRGCAMGDYDNDGDPDLLVMNLNDSPDLLHNCGGSRSGWLGLELEGTVSNRDAIGARVEVHAGGRVLMRQVQRGYGYLSAHDPRLLFGLGDATAVERVRIRWPSGRTQTLERPALRRYLVVREGTDGIARSYGRDPVADEGLLASARGPAGGTPSAPAAPRYAAQPAWSGHDHYRRGTDLYRHGRYLEAVEAFRASLELGPDSVRAYYSLGVTLYSGLGRTEEAIAVLEQAMQRDSTWSAVCQLLGVAHMEMNRTTDALAFLERARRLEPRAWQVHNRLGLVHLRRADLLAAEAALREASRCAPWMPHPHLNLARVYDQLGRPEAALRERGLFAELRPTEEQVERYLDNLATFP